MFIELGNNLIRVSDIQAIRETYRGFEIDVRGQCDKRYNSESFKNQELAHIAFKEFCEKVKKFSKTS